MIYLYTGDGEGKTSAAFGHVVRALGYEKKVLVIQFMKVRETGEVRFLKQLNVPVFQFGREEFVFEFDDEYLSLLRKGWELFEKKHHEFDLVVLDEFAYVCSKNVFSENELNFLKEVRTDVIITGRDAPDSLIQIADMVSEIKKVKHPYDTGFLAKQGLDY